MSVTTRDVARSRGLYKRQRPLLPHQSEHHRSDLLVDKKHERGGRYRLAQLRLEAFVQTQPAL